MIDTRLLLCGLLAMTIASAHVSAEDLDAEELSYSCLGCHGENAEGFKDLGAPRLAGQNAGYLAEQTINFRDGLRGFAEGDVRGAEMRLSVEGFTDGQIEALSEYFEAFDAPLAEADVPAGDLTAGKQLYEDTCAACHGFKAIGSAAVQAPNLVILSPWYFKEQMKAYEQGWRGGEKSTTRAKHMRSIAGQVSTPKQLDDLIAYITSLRSDS